MNRLMPELLVVLAISGLLTSGFAFAAKVTGPVTCVPAGQEDLSKAWVNCTPFPGDIFTPPALQLPQTSHRFEINELGQAVISDEPLSKFGYIEEEFFLEGMAQTYTSAVPLSSDGFWNVEKVGDSEAPYKIRILVQRPVKPQKFNGTVVLEYSHPAIGGIDFGWTFMKDEILDGGYAHVVVSPVAGTGEELFFINILDPERYASLVHPGELDYGWDIFTQAAKEIRNPSPGSVDPMGGLEVERIIATGHSFGAAALKTYINAVQPLENAFDGFLPTDFGAGGLPLNFFSEMIFVPFINNIRTDLVDTKVIRLNTEWSLLDAEPFLNQFGTLNRQDDTLGLANDMYRGYEFSGGAHVPRNAFANYGYFVGTPIDEAIVYQDCLTEGNDGIAHNYVHNAVLFRLNEWIKTGEPAPVVPRMPVIEIAPGDFDFDRDGVGNALGGIRPPAIDVPIARYDGRWRADPTPAEGDSCNQSAVKVPLDQATLDALYPTHGSYASQVAQSATDMKQNGFLRPYDFVKIQQEAAGSAIGK